MTKGTKKVKSAKITGANVKLSLAPGYILIEPTEAETKTSAGIYLPETASEKPLKGKVLAVGNDFVTEHGATIPCPVTVGDLVIYKKWGGNEVKLGNKEYLFAKFEDILAVEE